MLTLTRAKHSGGQAGEPLPAVFKKFDSNTIHFRRGQLTLVAAAPGVGKSLLTLTIAIEAGVPAYYFSADTDAFTMYLRGASLKTGWRMEDIEASVKAGNTELIESKLNGMEHIQFDFSPNPSVEDIEEELKAFAMTYGEWPHLIVIDNLRNVYAPDAGEDMDELCDYLHTLAKTTGAAVIALHHVKGSYNDGSTPIPLSGLIGQIGKVPECILTLYRTGLDDNMTLWVSPVKNRTGKSDPSGGWALPLVYEPARMRLEG